MIDWFCIRILIKQPDYWLLVLYLLWHKEIDPNWQKKNPQKTKLNNQNSLSEINILIP